jgi:hypothetical protein
MFYVMTSHGGARVSCMIFSYLPSSRGLSKSEQADVLANHFENLENIFLAYRILYS